MTRPRPLAVSTLAVATVVALSALVGCGSTRYVVVEGGGAGAAVAPTTAAPAGPTSAADEKDVKAAVDGALTLDPKVAFKPRTKFLTGSDDLEPTFISVRKLVSQVDAELKIDKVVVDGDKATATVTILVAGEPYAAGVPVALVREDKAWKVTRDGACAALAIGSPCPDK